MKVAPQIYYEELCHHNHVKNVKVKIFKIYMNAYIDLMSILKQGIEFEVKGLELSQKLTKQ